MIGSVISLHYCNKGVKTGANVLYLDVLEGVVKQLSNALFDGEHCIFKQNSAGQMESFNFELIVYAVIIAIGYLLLQIQSLRTSLLPFTVPFSS